MSENFEKPYTAFEELADETGEGWGDTLPKDMSEFTEFYTVQQALGKIRMNQGGLHE